MLLHFGTRLSRTIRTLFITTACVMLIACGGKSVEGHIAQAQQHISSVIIILRLLSSSLQFKLILKTRKHVFY